MGITALVLNRRKTNEKKGEKSFGRSSQSSISVIVVSTSRPRSLNSTRTSRAHLAQQRNASRQSRLNAGGDGFRLDSTRMRGPPSAAAATAASQAADDDAEEGDDGVDDCLKTSSDGVDNGHDAVADGAELAVC